jgi:predicted secreted protein
MKRLLISALFCVSALAFAGDAAKLTHIGASADGASFAFMESGIGDGMGNAYARIRIIDTLKNKYAAPAIERFQTEEEMENPSINLLSVEADVLKKADATLKKLNITTAIKGNIVASRKVTDLEARKLKELSFSVSAIIAGLVSPSYKLKLSLSKATPAAGAACLVPDQAKKLKLEITDNQSKKTRTLQADASLPATRGCVHNYEIEDVVVIQPDQSSDLASKVVVLLRVYTYGFEGEDVRYMAISGALNVE